MMTKKLNMKTLFKPKTRMPIELVKHMHELLIFIDQNTDAREQKRKEKMEELTKAILEIRTVVYGDDDSEPNKDSCAQLTREFFREDTFRLLIVCLSKLNLGDRQNATHVIANLQRQKVQSRIIALEYLENNIDIMDILIKGLIWFSYEDNSDIALSYGAITRECIRHQNIARYVLESDHVKEFFYYIQTPNFDVASDAATTFKELMTRHKSTVAEFLSKNYEWFFHEYNSQLLESPNYITKRQAIKLLGDMLLDRTNSDVMVRYVCSLHNMIILMNLLRDPKKTIKLETFQVFKLFVANQNKPPEIVNVLVKNRTKLIRFLNDFTIEKEDKQFEANKAQVINEISVLKLKPSNPKMSSVCSFRTNCAIQC
ncbi:putative MO25-like protein At5g47540 isoform X1 [Malus sylvestris]|uniref:putative MO25-like protein At5g47540 isoform X1 n=1 Tax=Malus sylvestris TaxID=3752 RepID=UPI0021AC0503|nr:putative MO25-like protein At5g47540 isoform X1 [Malus sylvestris]